MKPREQRTPSWGRASATPAVATADLPQPFTVDQLHEHAGVAVSLDETKSLLDLFVAHRLVTAHGDGRYSASITGVAQMIGLDPFADRGDQ